jgi:hypothetical protein
MKPKLFIVRKYIMAKDAKQAISLDQKNPVHDVWIDEEWSKGNRDKLQDSIGLTV